MVSTEVMPMCGSSYFFLPFLEHQIQASCQGYKKLLPDSFPRSPDEQPNERMISKLCEYTSKNPLRIPKITTSLEQKFYKDLPTEQFHSVKVIVHVYRKLMISCKEQMPLFASSFLSIIQILLDETRMDHKRVLGCQALFVFVNNQGYVQLRWIDSETLSISSRNGRGQEGLGTPFVFCWSSNHFISGPSPSLVSLTLPPVITLSVNLKSTCFVEFRGPYSHI